MNSNKYKKPAFVEIVRFLPAMGIALVVLAVVLVIGASIGAKTYQQAAADLSALPTALQTDANGAAQSGFAAMDDFGDNLPIVMAAIGGGLALLALLSGIGRASTGNL